MCAIDDVEKRKNGVRSMDERIAIEIRAHPQWCSSTCQTFSAQAYELARRRGWSVEAAQHDYDCCHMFR